MDVRILRGQNQIGGSIVEVSCDESRILLDVGMELDEEGPPVLPDIAGAFQYAGYDAVFISHYHADHIGLVPALHPNIPVYIGREALCIVKACARYTGKAIRTPFMTFAPGMRIRVGGMTVTPFLADHSAFDAYMFLIEGDGQKILYTGDFRSNGRKSYDELLRALPRHVDILICEGTALGRGGSANIRERELEGTATGLLRARTGPAFILQSSTNVDRMVSMYNAAKAADRLFLQELYMAEIACAAGESTPNPRTFRDVRVFVHRGYAPEDDRYATLQTYGRRAIGRDRIAKARFAMCVRSSMLSYLQKLRQRMDYADGLLLYSMWEGYKREPGMLNFLSECEAMGLAVVSLHTSGHADAQAIVDLVERVNPSRILPIHTGNAGWFGARFPGIEVG